MIFRTTSGLLLGLAMLVTIGACGPMPWVNIPAQQGDVAINNPNYNTALTVAAHAIRAAERRNSIDEPYIVLLPEGTSAESYAKVLRRLGHERARSAWEGHEEGMPVVEVARIEIRARNARAEVLMPKSLEDPQGPRMQATVRMKRPALSDWRTDWVRTWEFAVPALDLDRFDEFKPEPDEPEQPDEPDAEDDLDQQAPQQQPEQAPQQADTQQQAEVPAEDDLDDPDDDDARFELEPLDPLELPEMETPEPEDED